MVVSCSGTSRCLFCLLARTCSAPSARSTSARSSASVSPRERMSEIVRARTRPLAANTNPPPCRENEHHTHPSRHNRTVGIKGGRGPLGRQARPGIKAGSGRDRRTTARVGQCDRPGGRDSNSLFVANAIAGREATRRARSNRGTVGSGAGLSDRGWPGRRSAAPSRPAALRMEVRLSCSLWPFSPSCPLLCSSWRSKDARSLAGDCHELWFWR